jgi:hypothetical protein
VLGHTPELGVLADKYTWVKEIDAWTVAVVSGVTRDDLVRTYGGDPDSAAGDYLFSQMGDLGGDPDGLGFHVQVINAGDHVVAIENNGWSGSHPEIARRCSNNDRDFFSVYWNTNSFGLLTQAVNGKVTARFEFLYPIAPNAESGEIRPDWAIGEETDPPAARQTCFALLEQQTGVTIDPYWLGQQRPTYPIPEPHWLFRNVEGADQP